MLKHRSVTPAMGLISMTLRRKPLALFASQQAAHDAYDGSLCMLCALCSVLCPSLCIADTQAQMQMHGARDA